MKLVVLGAGGLAREVAVLSRDISEHTGKEIDFVGYVVSDLSCVGEYDSKSEILGDYVWLQNNRSAFDAIAIGIGSPAYRIKVAKEVNELCPGIAWPVLIHPTATYCKKSVRFGEGAIVTAGVRMTVNIDVGKYALLNLNVTVGHETRIGEGVVINPSANISGGVELHDGVLVGTGAQVLQYLSVGNNSTVGAGAVVSKNVAPNTTVVGIPARPLLNK